jgi:DNA polymerase-3 subunit alpha
MTNFPFVHLHVHSEYSILDGSIKIKKLVKELAKQGYPAAALTDHDGMHGALEFYLACQSEKINGIIGHEINIEPLFLDNKKSPTHLILLAENEEGYKNLIKLCTIANTSGLNRLSSLSTNISWEELKQYSRGLICLTSCMMGELSQLLLNHQEDQAKSYLSRLKDIFGKDHLFVELIDNGISKQATLIPQLVTLAKECDLSIVASADVHYLHKEDKQTHLSLLAIKNKLRKSDLKNMPEDVHLHLCSAEEMWEKFATYPEALNNTIQIAQRCQVKIDTKSIFMPEYTEREGESSDDCLIRLSRDGLENRKQSVQKWMGEAFTEIVWQEYKDRLEYELSVITKMKFSGYFLIVQDFINWAKKQNIPVGPGRGSAAGSLVTYSLHITNIDPIRFNLLFERFLNPERISMPDIDTDFCQDRREEVLQYVYQKYGKGAVSQIVTFGRMMARNALKNLARISGWSFNESNEFAKLIPETPGITLEQALQEEPKIKERIESDERSKTLWDGAIEIEGTLSSLGIHAAGVIISDRSLDNTCPLLESEGQLLTQFENKYAEKVGLIKFDFLGLKTLTVINNAVKIIEKTKNIKIDIEDINLNDDLVYQFISTANVTGIFQLESSGMRKLIADLKPTCFTDIIAVLALFRPGPLGSGMVEDFVKRKHGQTEVEYPFPELEPILGDTYGVIVYQEQVQKIAAVLASYSLGEADLLRRAMGKKDKNEMERQKTRFVSGAQGNGYPAQQASDLFDLMAKFAEYGFNKSHTAAYGWVTYQTAWLKTYYPTEFMTAIMTCDLDNTDKIVTYVRDCKRMKITILPPDVNHSYFEFSTPKNMTIQFGLGAVKGLGHGMIQLIVDERTKNGPFASVPEFIARVDARKLNKKVMESLIKSGSFDHLEKNRAFLMANSDQWIKTISKELERKDETAFHIFQFAEPEKAGGVQDILQSVQNKPTKDWPFHEKLNFEFASLGFYMSAHPSDFYKSDLNEIVSFPLCDVAMHLEADDLPDYKRKIIKVAGIVTMLLEKKNRDGQAFLVLKIEDATNELELVLFHKQYTALQNPIVMHEPLFIECKIKKGIEQGSVKGVIQSVTKLSQKRIELVKRITLKTKDEFLQSQDHMIQLEKILKKNQGKTPVTLDVFLSKEKTKLKAKLGNHSIVPNDAFLMDIEKEWPNLVEVERQYQLVVK